MIKKVIHIADIHIPNLEDKRPFSKMLKQALSEIYNEVKTGEKDETRIVLVGDIFDKKIKSSNEASGMFHETLNYLNAMAKTFVIAGNHDMLENNQSRKDSIAPTFDINGIYPNVIYLDKAFDYQSGCMVDDGIIWALYSMHGKFLRPDIESYKKEHPDYKVIGLYHGDVPGAVTDGGRVSENGISFSEFEGCDCVMAGHIHRYQAIKKKGINIVYSSSLFQKDMGENVSGHGFVVWDIETMKFKLHEVKNDYNTYKFKISSFDDVKEDCERLMNL